MAIWSSDEGREMNPPASRYGPTAVFRKAPVGRRITHDGLWPQGALALRSRAGSPARVDSFTDGAALKTSEAERRKCERGDS